MLLVSNGHLYLHDSWTGLLLWSLVGGIKEWDGTSSSGSATVHTRPSTSSGHS